MSLLDTLPKAKFVAVVSLKYESSPPGSSFTGVVATPLAFKRALPDGMSVTRKTQACVASTRQRGLEDRELEEYIPQVEASA